MGVYKNRTTWLTTAEKLTHKATSDFGDVLNNAPWRYFTVMLTYLNMKHT